jgi:membrane-bound ClpP family serine protease
VSWLALTFAGLGLIAARNATVMAAGVATALAVAGAMFLILELDTPYGGVITISDAPLRLALEHLGR